MPFRNQAKPQTPFPPLALAVLLAATFGLRRASAQTVLVQSAPPGAAVELTLNGANVATATADSNGDAILRVGPRSSDAGVLVYIDACGAQISVHMVNRGVQPVPASPSCTRTDVGSAFSMQPATTFVIDITPTPAVHVRQGPAPREWVLRPSGAGGGLSLVRSSIFSGRPGKGLVLSAGAGFSKLASAVDKACGDAPKCSNSNLGLAESLGAELWLTRYLGAQVGYVRPTDVTASGGGDTYSFDSRVTLRLLTVAAKAGVALGPVRLYGLGGVNHHEATITTNETVNDVSVTVNNVTQTIKGGTQSFAQQTKGWSWLAGGGVEAWSNRWIAIYGEANIAKITGAPVSGGEGGIDDRMTFAVIGARVHIGR
jgi:hypothetical protein